MYILCDFTKISRTRIKYIVFLIRQLCSKFGTHNKCKSKYVVKQGKKRTYTCKNIKIKTVKRLFIIRLPYPNRFVVISFYRQKKKKRKKKPFVCTRNVVRGYFQPSDTVARNRVCRNLFKKYIRITLSLYITNVVDECDRIYMIVTCTRVE